MVALIIILLFLGLLSYGFLPGVFFLALALSLPLAAVQPESGVEQLVLLFSFVSVFPLSAYATGLFLDRYAFEDSKHRFFCVAALSVCMVSMLDTKVLSYYLELLLNASISGNFAEPVLVLLSVASAGVFCAGLVSVVLAGLTLIFEIPVRWVLSLGNLEDRSPVSAIRPYIVLVIASFSLHLISSLFVSEILRSHG